MSNHRLDCKEATILRDVPLRNVQLQCSVVTGVAHLKGELHARPLIKEEVLNLCVCGADGRRERRRRRLLGADGGRDERRRRGHLLGAGFGH